MFCLSPWIISTLPKLFCYQPSTNPNVQINVNIFISLPVSISASGFSAVPSFDHDT
ncbi:hypothetical protein UPYG_G00319140 [Umbra pygmaea]|uniref:Uncharacterized protein n=1 Tax=Umbra pygmaea TaxID=75934 RepID=A0ABD0W068_UMBPY